MRLSERGDTAKWPKTWACPRGSLAKRDARKSTTSLHRVMVERETTRLRRENQQRARDFKRHSWRQVKYEFVEMNRKAFPVAAICRVLGVSPLPGVAEIR